MPCRHYSGGGMQGSTVLRDLIASRGGPLISAGGMARSNQNGIC